MDFGILSILPPIIAIILAIATKEVVVSLGLGILVGGLIYTGGDPIGALEELTLLMADKFGSNSMMIIFLVLLGSLVYLMNRAGGSFAYGKWAKDKIKTKSMAKFSTFILGALIFIDDYFNCLTVGTVMRPICQENNVSSEKLAHIIDSTAAPVCIIAPISSWAASIIAIIADSGLENPMAIFVSAIPFNFYAIFAIFIVIFTCFSKGELGVMQSYENSSAYNEEEGPGYEHSDKARVFDLIIPIITLIGLALLMMLRTGGYFDGASLAEAFGDADVNLSLVVGAVLAIIVAGLLYIPRKLISFSDFMEGFISGMHSMTQPIVILALAWTIGGITSEEFLNTASYISGLLTSNNVPITVLPAIIFLVAALLSFSTGTAWGTFGILIPIAIPIVQAMGEDSHMVLVIAAILSGSVFGDHASPISDTTILSSAGAGSDHLAHVTSQLPYTIIAALCAFVGFLIEGLTNINYSGLIGGIILVVLVLKFGMRISRKKYAS